MEKETGDDSAGAGAREGENHADESEESTRPQVQPSCAPCIKPKRAPVITMPGRTPRDLAKADRDSREKRFLRRAAR